MGKRSKFYAVSIAAVVLLLAVCAIGFPQQQERPKLKDFGSSLKRARWNDQKKAAVDSKSKATANSASDEIDVVKVETSLVTSDFLVLDPRGNPVSGLTEKDFVITEDGKPQSVGMLSQGDNLKISRTIVLIFDHSPSKLSYIKTSFAAAKALIDKLPESDSMAIVTDQVKLIQDFTNNKKTLKDKLDSLLPGTIMGTHNVRGKQYSALLATLNEAFNGEDQRPIVIFQTNGDQLALLRDTPFRGIDKRPIREHPITDRSILVNFSLDDILRAAEKARATIYTVVPEPQLLGRSTDEQVARAKRWFDDGMALIGGRTSSDYGITYEKLKTLAYYLAQQHAGLEAVSTSTGGWTKYLEKPEDAGHIYNSIFSDINQRYIVGYYPTNKDHDGKRRKIAVTIRDHPDYKVLGRVWYYAPGADQ